MHLTSAQPMVFSINSKQIGWIEREYESIDLLVSREDFILSCFPISESAETVSLSFSAKISAKANKLICDSKNITVTDYGKGHFALNVLPMTFPRINTRTPPFYKVLGDVMISVNNSIINLSNGKNTLFHPLQTSIHNIDAVNSNELILVSGKTPNEKDYNLFINRNLQVEFEGTADKIEYTNNKIVTLNNVGDIARHGLVTTYERRANGFHQTQQYSVYTQNDPVPPASDAALPLAFMEAINIENYTLARSYLHPSLSTALQDEQISAYFGDFIEVTLSPDGNPYNLALSFAGNPRFVKIYHFTVKDNHITDIDTI